MKIVTLLALAFLISACEGPMGPVGPSGVQGAQGPQGLPGEAAQIAWDRIRLGSDGGGVISFSNAQVETSVVNCYISDSTNGPWLKVAFDTNPNFSGTSCGVANSGNSMRVILINGIPGWWFLATAAVAP
jgi:hypothetical protein